MLAAVRTFFAERGVMEVDTPVLSRSAPIDLHIDIMDVALENGTCGFLHSSPEYAMKRLLSAGSGDIYQLSHVFRRGEVGRLHNPEFTMLEWYRVGGSFEALILETLAVIHLFLPPIPPQRFTYRETLRTFASIDYVTADKETLLSTIRSSTIPHPRDIATWDKTPLLQFIMGFIVEPQFGPLTVVTNFPKEEAMLAKTSLEEGVTVASRFEIYADGIELANGFHELTDAEEQRKRLLEQNGHRKKLGKPPLPIDENFLSALASGLPDCCGVAVGFDRLMMLRHGCSSLADILPMSWNQV
jgi:lysyl-tRNA synthetase class 2